MQVLGVHSPPSSPGAVADESALFYRCRWRVVDDRDSLLGAVVDEWSRFVLDVVDIPSNRKHPVQCAGILLRDRGWDSREVLM